MKIKRQAEKNFKFIGMSTLTYWLCYIIFSGMKGNFYYEQDN